MTKDAPSSVVSTVGLARYSVVLVSSVFGLITVGGLVTSWNAGMAVPDWPLSFGSLNPSGWWADFAVRLEHGHRLYAAAVGVLVGILVAWLHGNFRALGGALLTAVMVGILGRFGDISPELRMHLGLWCPALVYLGLLFRRKPDQDPGVVRLGRIVFLLVCLQATLGGLRVTQETAGSIDVALVLRVFHGCVAQVFLAILVMISVSLVWGEPFGLRGGRTARWILLVCLFGQLVLGATIRHKGAGLAIPTFPAVDASGALIPVNHGFLIDLHFTHSRMLPMLIVGLTLWIWKSDQLLSGYHRGIRLLPPLLVLLQVALGVSVIWSGRSAGLTTLHVLTGAMLLASVVLNLRLDSRLHRLRREGEGA